MLPVGTRHHPQIKNWERQVTLRWKSRKKLHDQVQLEMKYERMIEKAFADKRVIQKRKKKQANDDGICLDYDHSEKIKVTSALSNQKTFLRNFAVTFEIP